MTDVLKRNANLVDALGSALREGEHAIGTVPALVKRILAEESWREFVTQRGEHVRHERFETFVTAKPLRGIGAELGLIRRVINDDPEAVDLLDRAVQRPVGRPRNRDNDTNSGPDPNARGTSRDYALRRLRKDAPDLHADVLAGHLTPHAAMVKAGFTPARFTVQITSPESIAATLTRHLPAETLREVAKLLGACRASP